MDFHIIVRIWMQNSTQFCTIPYNLQGKLHIILYLFPQIFAYFVDSDADSGAKMLIETMQKLVGESADAKLCGIPQLSV